MPFQPAPEVDVGLADEDTPFDLTLATAGTAEDLVTVPVNKLGRSISLVNEGPGSVFIEFDGVATLTSVEVTRRESYSEAHLAIGAKVSFIGETGKTPRVRGVLWSGS